MSDINFSKLTWENLPARTTALSATNLNRIENGIADSVNGINSNSHSIAELQTRISQIASGSPTPVSTVAEMTDESAVYLYTGSESGYTAGNWYYYNGTAWTSGGTYGGAVTDTTLSISGAPADAKAVGDALAEKADADDLTSVAGRVTALKTFADDAIQADQFKNPVWTDGSMVRYDDGSEYTQASYSYAEFSVSGRKAVHVDTYMASVAGVCFYDSEDVFMAGYKNDVPSDYSATLSVPAGATSMKVSCVTVHKENLFIYQYMQEEIDSIEQDVSEMQETLGMAPIPSGNAKTATESYNAVITSDSRLQPTTNVNFTLRKYPVTKGSVYIIKGSQVEVHYNTYGLAAFSENDYTGTRVTCQLIIYGSGATPTDYDVIYTVPADGYLYLLSYGTESYKPVLDLYDTVTVPKLMYTLTGTTKDVIKVQAFGDSITDDSWRSDGTTWLTLLPDYIPQRQFEIKNEGVGGSHIGHGKVNSETGKYHELEYNYVYDLMTNTDIFDPDSDIITMFIGTNDFNSGALGQWGDTSVDTFYGAARTICEYISNNTSALFLVITPIARPDNADESKAVNEDGERINRYGATLRDYVNALIKTCEFYQFPVIDLFHNIGWNPYNIRPYLDTSGIHPSKKGSNVICANIASVIKAHLGI